MKRIVVFIVVGLIMFGIGFGGGLMMGRTMAENVGQGAGTTVRDPGPIVPIGEFTSNLAGSGRRIINFSVSLETINNRAADIINSPGWNSRIRNEILLLVSDKVAEDLTSAEGRLQLAEEIRRTLNSGLPRVNGEVPIVRVLFDSFILQ